MACLSMIRVGRSKICLTLLDNGVQTVGGRVRVCVCVIIDQQKIYNSANSVKTFMRHLFKGTPTLRASTNPREQHFNQHK